MTMSQTLRFHAMRAAVGLACAASLAAQDFAKDVAPIFAASCIGCHAGSVKMGGLDLDTVESILKGGNNGPVITPGKSAESRLYMMVSGKMNPSMPLGGRSLAAGEIEQIGRWIDGGAKSSANIQVSKLNRASIPKIAPRKPVTAQIAALAYSPDGSMLALATYREVRLTDPTGKTVATLGGHVEQVRAVAFSPDGKRLAAAGGLPGRKGEVKVWDVAARKEIVAFNGHSDCIYTVAFSPDGKTLATAGYDRMIYLWDAATGEKTRTLKDHIDAIYALAFTPDGSRLISVSADRGVKVWNPATGERLFTQSEALDGLNALAIDPLGKLIAAGGLDKTIRLWKLGEKGGTLVNSLIAHEDAILQLAFSPDGKFLVSSAADRAIKVLKTEDLSEVLLLPRQPDWVTSLRFAPDGRHFAAGRFDGSLEIYELKEATNVATR